MSNTLLTNRTFLRIVNFYACIHLQCISESDLPNVHSVNCIVSTLRNGSYPVIIFVHYLNSARNFNLPIFMDDGSNPWLKVNVFRGGRSVADKGPLQAMVITFGNGNVILPFPRRHEGLPSVEDWRAYPADKSNGLPRGFRALLSVTPDWVWISNNHESFKFDSIFQWTIGLDDDTLWWGIWFLLVPISTSLSVFNCLVSLRRRVRSCSPWHNIGPGMPFN